jgi:hypothetical protein
MEIDPYIIIVVGAKDEVCEVDMLHVRARGFNKYGFSQFVI